MFGVAAAGWPHEVSPNRAPGCTARHNPSGPRSALGDCVRAAMPNVAVSIDSVPQSTQVAVHRRSSGGSSIFEAASESSGAGADNGAPRVHRPPQRTRADAHCVCLAISQSYWTRSCADTA